MELHEVTIEPKSPLGTPLKGDTLFGHFCWQAVYDKSILNHGLERWIELYPEKPFIVFSSAFPKFEDGGQTFFAFSRPSLPQDRFNADNAQLNKFKRLTARKEDRKKKWLITRKNLKIKFAADLLINDKELFDNCWKSLPEEIRFHTRLSSEKNILSSEIFFHFQVQ